METFKIKYPARKGILSGFAQKRRKAERPS